MRALSLISVLGSLTMTGCGLAGPTCQSSCRKLYMEDECNIKRAGYPAPDGQTELFEKCMNYCEYALDRTGDLGDYDPYSRSGSTTSIELDNEMQAAVWMDCIDQMACDRLDTNTANGGYCQPVW